MWFKSKLVWVVSLIAAAVLVAAIASVLPLTHVNNKPGTSARANFNAPTPIGLPVNVSLNVPVYVVGPQTLVQKLVGVGVPQSLIKPIGLNQLPSLPSNSIVVVDWSVIKPYIAYSTIGKNITLNLTSPAVGLLEGLFAKGDLVLVNVSRSEAPIAELLLSYTMARGANVVVYGPNGARFYLVPMLEMPINSKYVLIGATAIETPHGIAVLVGPVNLEELPNLIKNWLVPIEAAKGLIKLPTTNQDPTNWDPCYAFYWKVLYSGSQNPYTGVYTRGNLTFLWGMPILGNQAPPLGVAAVQDNYSDVFYYDSCILMANSILAPTPSQQGVIPAELMGDTAYYATYSGGVQPGFGELYYLIGGFDMYTSYESLGNEVEFNGICYPYFYNAYVADYSGSYEPTPTGFPTGSFSINIGILPPSISITYTVPNDLSDILETISVSKTPYENQGPYYEYNLTWTFAYTYLSPSISYGTYIDGFTVGQGGNAFIFLENYSPGGEYWFYLPFNAEVVTVCWSAWAKMAWVVGLVTSSSNTTSISTAYFGYPPFQPPSNAPGGSWISGYSMLQPWPCGISLSGPS